MNKRTKAKVTLNRETLRQLEATDLGKIAGATGGQATCPVVTCQATRCVPSVCCP